MNRWISPAVLATATALMAGWTMPAAAQGLGCDDLRAQIEGKIQAAGVQRFSVTVEDAAAPPSGGQVVGHCDQGASRIVYRRQVGNSIGTNASTHTSTNTRVAPASTAATAPIAATPPRPAPLQPRTDASTILTECKDGRVVRGNCD